MTANEFRFRSTVLLMIVPLFASACAGTRDQKVSDPEARVAKEPSVQVPASELLASSTVVRIGRRSRCSSRKF